MRGINNRLIDLLNSLGRDKPEQQERPDKSTENSLRGAYAKVVLEWNTLKRDLPVPTAAHSRTACTGQSLPCQTPHNSSTNIFSVSCLVLLFDCAPMRVGGNAARDSSTDSA